MTTQAQNELAKGAPQVSPQFPARKISIHAKDFTQSDQAVPIALPFGRPKKFSGVQITPIFGFRSIAITQEQGK